MGVNCVSRFVSVTVVSRQCFFFILFQFSTASGNKCFFFSLFFIHNAPPLDSTVAEDYTKTRLCLLIFRIFPSLCLAVAIPFLGRFPNGQQKKNRLRDQIHTLLIILPINKIFKLIKKIKCNPIVFYQHFRWQNNNVIPKPFVAWLLIGGDLGACLFEGCSGGDIEGSQYW